MLGRILLLVTLAWLSGCGKAPSPWPVAFDLVAGLAVADRWTETRDIELASRRGRRHLDSGWSADRWDRRRQRGFVVNKERRTTIAFDVIEVRPLVVRFLAGPVAEERAEPQAIEVLVNGNPAGTLEVQGRPRRYRQPVAAGFLRPGRNELMLRHPESSARLADRIRWYQVEFLYADASEPPEPRLAGEAQDGILIPYGTRLEYTLMLPAESLLGAASLRHVGEAGGTLSVLVEEDGKPVLEVPLTGQTGREVEVALPAGPPRIVRLTLRAEHPDSRIAGRAGALLTGAVIRSRPAAVTADASPVGEPGPTVSTVETPNILLYVVDTLRADHLGIYGYDRPVSPALDAFAERATVFENAVAQSSWTRAAMASIFTGLWPVKHATNGRKDILDEGATTLAEVLRDAGYVTAAKVRNWNVFPVFGFRQGFEEFHKVRDGKADRVNRLVEDWLDDRPADRPFFLWVHTVDPHEPYRPPEPTREMFLEENQPRFDFEKHPPFKLTREMSTQERQEVARYLISLYDAEIAFNDRAFGELIALLEVRDLLASTVVIFVSDHGEEFLDHGTWGHGRNLYAENLNVPLVIRFPDRGHGRRVPQVVQQIDLMPTLLDYLGMPIPERVEGRSFLSLLTPDDEGPSTTPLAYSFLHLDGAAYRSVVDDDWKLVQRLSDDGEVAQSALYHRGLDPRETENRILDLPIRARFMELLLDAKMAEGTLLTTEEAILDEETENALKALGYLQ